jgi:hypothetical protein
MSVLASEFDQSLVTFGEVKVLQSGAKSVPMNYAGSPLVMQLSNLEVPYGLNTEDKYGPTKYSMNLSLRDYDTNPKVKSVYDALSALDQRVMAECVEKNWLKKPGMTQQILQQMKLYKPTVKFSEDENGNRKPWPPTVKAALRKNAKTGQFETAFYDADRNEMKETPIEEIIVRRMTVTVLLECTGVWASSAGCGLSWKVTQLKAVKYPGLGRGYAFKDDGDDAPRASQPTQATPSAQVTGASKFEAAFDDEDDLDAAVEPATPSLLEAPPPPKKVATVIKKKVVVGAK